MLQGEAVEDPVASDKCWHFTLIVLNILAPTFYCFILIEFRTETLINKQ